MTVRTGLDVLLHEERSLLAGRRVGLVSHAAAVLPDFTPAADALLQAGVQLTALFGPEHGFSGAAADGAAVGHGVDQRLGLPLFSLYGATRQPTPEMLNGVDVLLFDMQDVGVRFYTYLSTLFYVLRGAAAAGKPVIVADRPNPLGGVVVEGGLVQPGFESFVGIAALPIRHGLTFGELAHWLNRVAALGADLQVVRMRGWQRTMFFEQTGLPWVPTSPAMPHLSTVMLYPGMCLFEGLNVSEGRGTALPFELFGAPDLDAWALAESLNRRAIRGARFRPVWFTPSASKFAGQSCAGVQVHAHMQEPEQFRSLEVGVRCIEACLAASAAIDFLPASWEGHAPHFDLLAGGAALRTCLRTGDGVDRLLDEWRLAAAAFVADGLFCRVYEPIYSGEVH